MSSMTRVRNIE